MHDPPRINGSCVIGLCRIRVVGPKPVDTRSAYIKIFQYKFFYWGFLPVFSIIYLNLGIPVEAVPALGSMEERMGVTDICPGEPHNSGQGHRHSYAAQAR